MAYEQTSNDCWKAPITSSVAAYDYRHRRTSKTVQRLHSTIPPPPSPPVGEFEWRTVETRTFVYDDWHLIHETVCTIEGGVTNLSEIQHFWGLDLSGTLQGAGGVGGLLATSVNGDYYFPAYDNNGNVTKYIDESGAVVAAYEYDDFGGLISASGPMAEVFAFRFSTKYFDPETSLYYYGYRFYSPELMRWLNRDPIEEQGGVNLFAFCRNNAVFQIDTDGRFVMSLDEIEQRYRDMVAAARRKGKNVAADNLEYFMSGAGGTRILDWRWLRSNSAVLSGEKLNKERFEEKLKEVANQMSNGDEISFHDYFDATKTASTFSELYYVSGTFTISSYGDFSLKCADCKVEISGDVDHRWWDKYDWHVGLSAFVPGFGNVNDADAQRLEDSGRAASFYMEAEWTQKLKGSYSKKRTWGRKAKFEWSSPSDGNTGIYEKNGRTTSGR